MINSVNILGIHFAVEYVEHIDEATEPSGITIPEQTKIQIRRDLSPQFKMLTLLHECVHAGQVVLCLDFAGDGEQVADSLALFIYNLYRDNPDLIDEIRQ